MSELASASLSITIDKQEIADQILSGLNAAQTKAKGEVITYQIAADEKSLKQLKEKIEALTKEQRATVNIDFSDEEYKKKISQLENYSSKKANVIGSSFKKSIQNSLKGSESEIAETLFGKGTRKKYSAIISEFGKEFKNGALNIENSNSLTDVEKYLTKLQALQIALRENGTKAVTGFSSSGVEKLTNDVNEAMKNIYTEAGKFVKIKSPVWVSELKEFAGTDIRSIQSLVESLSNGISNVGNGGNGFGAIEAEVEELNKKLQEANKLVAELEENQDLIAPDTVAYAYSRGGSDSGDKDFIKTFQDYIKYGGQIKEINQDIIKYYNDFKGQDGSFVPIKQLQEYNQKLVDSKGLVETLTADLNNMQAKATTGTNVVEPLSSTDSIKDQSDEVNRLQTLLDDARNTIDDINAKYIEQNNLVEELTKKQTKLDEFNNPKIVESDEYKKLSSDFQEAKKQCQSYSAMLEAAKEQANGLGNKLDEIKNGGSVPISDLENAQNQIVNLKDDLTRLQGAYEEAQSSYQNLSSNMFDLESNNGYLQQQNEELTKINASQKEQLESQQKEIENNKELNKQLEENKKKILEIQQAHDALEKKQKDVGKRYDNIDAYNNAVTNVNYNEGNNTPSGFVNFDYLEKVQDKLKETKDDYNELIKAAVYYHQYLQNGGTERAINSQGKDYTDELIATYKQMNMLASKNGLIEDNNFSIFMRKVATKLSAYNKEQAALDEQNKKLQKQVNLNNEIAKRKEQDAKKAVTSTVTETSTTATPTTANEEQSNKHLKMIEKIMSRRQAQKSSNTSDSSVTSTSEIPVKVVPDTTKFKEEADEQLSQIQLEDKDVNIKVVEPETNNVDSILEKITKLSEAITNLPDINIKENVDIINVDEQTYNTKSEYDKELYKAQKQYEEDIARQKEQDAKDYVSFWTNALNEVDAQNKVNDEIVSSDTKSYSSSIDKQNKDKYNSFLQEQKDYDKDQEKSRIEAVNKAYGELSSTIQRYGKLKETITKNDTLGKNNSVESLQEVKDLYDQIQSQEIHANDTLFDPKQDEKVYEQMVKIDQKIEDIINKANSSRSLNNNDTFDEATNINTAINNATSNINNIGSSKTFGGMDDSLTRTNEKLEVLNQKLIDGKITLIQYQDASKKLGISLDSIQGFADSPKEATEFMQDLISSMTQGKTVIEQFNKTATGIQGVTQEFKNADGQVQRLGFEWNEVTGEITSGAVKNQQAISGISKFVDQLKGKFGDLVRYLLSFASFYEIINILRQGVTVITELDTAMTELRKVSNDTTTALENFKKQSFEIADVVGTTSADLISSAADWSRLGYSIREASELAKNAAIYVNVGDGIDIDTATEDMVSAMKAFNIEASDSMEIVNAYNEVGNNFAISSSGIGEAMQRSASALATANNTFDQSIALITAMNEVIQDTETTGNTIKILSLRLRGASADLSDLGEDTDGVITSTSKLQEKIEALTNVDGTGGVNILTDTGDFKSTYDIIQGIAEKWQDISDINQAALLEIISGKTRANGVAALLNNWEQLDKVVSASENSQGSALAENEEYMKSIEGHLAQFKNAWQELCNDTATRDFVNGVIDIGTNLLNIIKEVGTLKVSLGAISTIFLAKTFTKNSGGRVKRSTLKEYATESFSSDVYEFV